MPAKRAHRQLAIGKQLRHQSGRPRKGQYTPSQGLTVDLEESVDSSLLGGLIVRVGDRKYDGSVRHKVRVLRSIFDERARQHIYQTRAEDAATA